MRNCEDYQEMISAELDGELSDEDAAALHAHLEQCESCRAYAALLSAVTESLREDTTPVPEGFAEGVMARVRLEKKKKRGRVIALRYGSIAAVLVLVLAAGRLLPLGAKSSAKPMLAAAPEAMQLRDVDTESAVCAPAGADEEAEPENGAVTFFAASGVAEEPKAMNELAGVTDGEGSLRAAPAPDEPAAAGLLADSAPSDSAYANEALPPDERSNSAETANSAYSNEEAEEKTAGSEGADNGAEDNANSFLPPQLPEGFFGEEHAELPAREEDLTLFDGTKPYLIWLEGELVIYAKRGETAAFYSPLPAAALREFLPK